MNRMDKLRYFWIRNNPWFKAPKYIYNVLRCKMFGTPNIKYSIDKMMFKLYDGTYPQVCHASSHKNKYTVIEVDKSYIKHDKLKKVIPKGWKVYKKDKLNECGQEVLYISKDDIDYNNDTYIYRHVNEYELDKRIKDRRFMKNKEYKDVLPQSYILTCKEDEEKHKFIRRMSNYYYNKKEHKELENLVKECIKDYNILNRSKSITGQWNAYPVLYKVVELNRLDLAEKLILSCEDKDDLDALINTRWENDEGFYCISRYGMTPIDFSKSDEMKELLSKYEVEDYYV